MHLAHDLHQEFGQRAIDACGVPPAERPPYARQLVKRLPFFLKSRFDSNRFATDLADVGVLSWLEDREPLDAAKTKALATALADVLRNVVRPAMPKLVAVELVGATRRILGARVGEATALALEAGFEQKLLRDLWRCQGEEHTLADLLLMEIAQEARVILDPPRSYF